MAQKLNLKKTSHSNHLKIKLKVALGIADTMAIL